MQQINTPDGQFHDGNPAAGELGTILTAAWLNALQAEILSVLADRGMATDPAKTNQLLDAIKKIAWGGLARPNTLAGYGITDALEVRPGQIGPTTDWNTIVNRGVYEVAGDQIGPNGPSAYGYGMLIVAEANDGGAVSQLYLSHGGSQVAYRGGYNNGAWNAWRRLDRPEFQDIQNRPNTLAGFGIADALEIRTQTIGDGYDWNNITARGVYDVATEHPGPNAPPAYGYGTLIVSEVNDGGALGQLYLSHGGSNVAYRGGYNNGGWNPWKRLDVTDYADITGNPDFSGRVLPIGAVKTGNVSHVTRQVATDINELTYGLLELPAGYIDWGISIDLSMAAGEASTPNAASYRLSVVRVGTGIKLAGYRSELTRNYVAVVKRDADGKFFLALRKGNINGGANWIASILHTGNIALADYAVSTVATLAGYTEVAALTNSPDIAPAGIPMPWPLATPPSGWVILQGQSFDTAANPNLAIAYPSGVLPDLRGKFIRGWDNGRGVDPGRALLSEQGAYAGSFTWRLRADDGDGQTGSFVSVTGVEIAGASPPTLPYNAWTDYVTSTVTPGDTRPGNTAFNYIVRLG
ncbi:tail fiber protein [Pseudogulbenkiania sp. MAI-1]|uniref:tail fiber protein n=1 Tax=Pseudogulbenkiania sp. MAI-1 TaxID=990370 RepID=UPI00045EB4E2|nr:tail fiber protein [Pseudogulbenkiania sp. MAI-1]